MGVLGSGVVGRSLARGFADRRHEVRIGTRSPAGNEELGEWLRGEGDGVSAGTFAEAAEFGDLLVLATLGLANEQVIEAAGAEHFTGKVLIDATNPLDFSDDTPTLAYGFDDSGGERVQRLLPGASVVKAFNIVTAGLMVDPELPDGPPTMFIAGDEEAAKRTVADILDGFGWPSIDIGGIEGARMLESLCLLWVTVGMRRGSWDQAFRLLTA